MMICMQSLVFAADLYLREAGGNAPVHAAGASSDEADDKE